MRALHLKRVPWGRPDTPPELREYKVMEFPTNAVGTIKEIEDFCKRKGIEAKLEVIE